MAGDRMLNKMLENDTSFYNLADSRYFYDEVLLNTSAKAKFDTEIQLKSELSLMNFMEKRLGAESIAYNQTAFDNSNNFGDLLGYSGVLDEIFSSDLCREMSAVLDVVKNGIAVNYEAVQTAIASKPFMDSLRSNGTVQSFNNGITESVFVKAVLNELGLSVTKYSDFATLVASSDMTLLSENRAALRLIASSLDGIADIEANSTAKTALDNSSLKESSTFSNVYSYVERFAGRIWLNSLYHSAGTGTGSIYTRYLSLDNGVHTVAWNDVNYTTYSVGRFFGDGVEQQNSVTSNYSITWNYINLIQTA